MWLQRADGRFLATGLIAVQKHLQEEEPGLRLFHRACVPLGQAHRAAEPRRLTGSTVAPWRGGAELPPPIAPAARHRLLVEDGFAQASIGIGIVALDGLWLRANRRLCDFRAGPSRSSKSARWPM